MMYKKIVFTATVLAFLLVMLGAFVRLSDAGLGCPDWPGCYGQVLAPHSAKSLQSIVEAFPEQKIEPAKAWKEMAHRYVAGILGLLILTIAILAWTQRRALGQSPWLASSLVGLVIFQAALGMWTVTLLLKPAIVTLHLLGGMATLALLTWLLLKRRRGHARGPYGFRFKAFGWVSLVVVFGQIALGGWVSANYAVLGCLDFPTCKSLWVPTMDFNHAFHVTRDLGKTASGELLSNDSLTAIHWVHRVGALITLLVVGVFALVCLKPWPLRIFGLAALILLTTQIGLGITNVLSSLLLPVAVAHNGVAALLLITIVVLNFRINSPSA